MSEAVQYYWRPGCPFCFALRRKLDKAKLATTDFNIWEDPAAAARVRSVADGNEVVPTVLIGDTALVNPTIEEVMDAVAVHSPELAPPRPSGSPANGLRGALKQLLHHD
ncbi:MAG: glutaredoxin domain-containing protein [Sciscionella sp.]